MSIVKIDGTRLELFENSGTLIRTITGNAVSASLSMDETEIVVVTETGAVERWDVRGNYRQTITGGATAARYSGDNIIVYLESGVVEVRDSRGNHLRNI